MRETLFRTLGIFNPLVLFKLSLKRERKSRVVKRVGVNTGLGGGLNKLVGEVGDGDRIKGSIGLTGAEKSSPKKLGVEKLGVKESELTLLKSRIIIELIILSKSGDTSNKSIIAIEYI